MRAPESHSQLPPQRQGISRTQIRTRPFPPAFQQQGAITHVRHQHPGGHRRTRPDTAPGPGGRLLTVTATEPLKTWFVIPVLHVCVAAFHLPVHLDGTQDRDNTGPVGSGGRVRGKGRTPVQRSARPWGLDQGAKGVRGHVRNLVS